MPWLSSVQRNQIKVFPQSVSQVIQTSHLYFSGESCSVVSNSCDTMDFSPPGSSVHGILQARILEWVAFRFSRGSSQPTDQTQVSHTASGFFTVWATWGSLRKLKWVAFPFSRDLPDPGIEPRSPALQVDSLSSVSASGLNVRTNSGHPSIRIYFLYNFCIFHY